MFARLFALILLFAGAMSVAFADGGGARDQLKSTVDEILGVLADTSLEKTEKRRKITESISARFDFRTMAQQILATNWKKTNEAQQKRFVELFSELLQESYVGRIEAYTNEKIEFKGEKLEDGRVTIDSVIHTSAADIPVQYKMLRKEDKWQVYDVVIEGISFIRSYRTNYQDVVKKDGIDGLLTQMEAKIATLRSEKKAS